MMDWPKNTDEWEGHGRPCPICGALVPVPRQEQHERWHLSIHTYTMDNSWGAGHPRHHAGECSFPEYHMGPCNDGREEMGG